MTDGKRALAAFRAQRAHAYRRGIEWRLTFDQWLAWWGDDLSRRGRGAFDWQMQRFHDRGAYELGNITKGHSRDNSRTYSNVRLAQASERARQAHEAALDVMMYMRSADDEPEEIEEMSISEFYARKAELRSSVDMQGSFRATKHDERARRS